MKSTLQLIKENWTDPVWSKVIAGVILSAMAGIVSFIYSLYKKIPIQDLYNKSITSYFCINYLTIVIVLIILFSIVISAILMDIVRFRLKNLKFPSYLKNKKINLQNYLEGKWILHYKFRQEKKEYKENVTFVNGNQYNIDNNFSFVLTDIQYFEDSKQIIWTKTDIKTSRKHSTETLIMVDNNNLIGNDDIGNIINYIRFEN